MSRESAPSEPPPSRHRLLRILGRGGMGVVWEAADDAGNVVAIKVLVNIDDDVSRRRILREARAVSALRHPNVVAIHGVVEVSGAPAIVMERLVGETLRERLDAADRLELPTVARILGPVSSALRAAHLLGIVHRDLKPENVFLCADGGVKVLDFGIAKLTAGAGIAVAMSVLTKAGAALGTPQYMSPEQLGGALDVDARSDAWSLGALLYECLSGGLPLEGTHVAALLKSLHMGAIVPLERLVPGLPPDVAWVASRLLAKDRAARLEDVSGVAAILGKYA